MNFKMKKMSKNSAIIFFFVTSLLLFTGCASKTMSVKEPDKGTVEPSASKLITDISTTEDSDSSIVWIKGNRLLTYTSVKQPFPAGVLLYFPETALDNIETAYQPTSDVVSSINATELTEKGHTSRIEILLKNDIPYEVTREDMGLKISFKKTAAIQAPVAQEVAKEEKPVQPEQGELIAKASVNKNPENENPEPQVKNDRPAWVDRIDFSSEDDGKSTIIIGTTAPIQYSIKKINDKKLLLNINNSKLPGYRQRPLITTRFQSAVDRITPFETPSMKDTSLVAIELRESVPYYVEQTDNLILIHFEASSIPPKPFDDAKLPPWKKVMKQMVAETEEAVKPVKEKMPGVPTGKFTGEKIALNFFETDIKNVFRILMDVSGKNFVIDKDVSGQVTLTLDKPVPWDQVLDLIIKMNQLGMIYEGDIVRILTLKTLKAEERAEKASKAEKIKLQAEEQSLEPLVTEYIPISYADASADVLPHIVLTARGKITVDQRNNQIIITDVAEQIEKAKEIVKQIDQVTPQVIIEARIVEATKSYTRDLGTEWAITAGPIDINGDDLTLDLSATNPPASTLGQIGVQFTRITDTAWSLVDLRLMASESDGLLKIISAPKILTLDNTAASIKQGLAYPYSKLDADGNTTVEFKDIALELQVTPHITPDNRVSMKITVKNNEIGAVIAGEVSFTTKEANTELLVDDGDTVIIGGIRKTRKSEGESGLPGLKNIPLLGWLFKSQSKVDDMEELLIFITPQIVKLEQHAMGF
jgi:type IV pilus assembly protein PilQ